MYSQTGQCAATHFLPPNVQKLFNKQTKKRKKKITPGFISLKSVSIKIKRIQVFFDIKLHVLQTASFFLTFNFAFQPANFAYIMKYTERLM